MKKTAPVNIRKTIGTLVFLLFLFSFINPENFFTPLSPYLEGMQYAPLFIKTFFNFTFWALAMLILLTVLALVFGRLYCSFLCPLGIFQDIIIYFSKTNDGFKKLNTEALLLKYLILTVTTVITVLGSLALVNLLDPYAVFGRIAANIFRYAFLGIQNAVSVILSLFGSYAVPIRNPHPVNVLLLATSFIMLAILIFLSFNYGRSYCTTICPVGTLLELLSKKAPFAIRINEKCIKCNKCQSSCKSHCINIKEMSVDNGECVRCFDCVAVCPVDAISYTLKKSKPLQQSTERKLFLSRSSSLALGAVALASLPARKLLSVAAKLSDVGGKRSVITPPGSLSRQHFTQSCISCHLCTAVCPTRIIKPSSFEYGPGGLMQPYLSFENGFCEFNCTECSNVCPTDAITNISITEKQHTIIGEAVFNKDHCIVYKDGTDCGACAEHCPTGACFVRRKKGLGYPHFDIAKCIGCGACEHVCPPQPKAVVVEALSIHKKREVETEDETLKDESTDFPF